MSKLHTGLIKGAFPSIKDVFCCFPRGGGELSPLEEKTGSVWFTQLQMVLNTRAAASTSTQPSKLVEGAVSSPPRVLMAQWRSVRT